MVSGRDPSGGPTHLWLSPKIWWGGSMGGHTCKLLHHQMARAEKQGERPNQRARECKDSVRTRGVVTGLPNGGGGVRYKVG